MDNGIEFMSVFKIAEKPILRPCLSDERRQEIHRLKAEALEIERRIAERKKIPTTHETNEKFGEFLRDMENVSNHSGNKSDNDVDNLATSISEWDLSSIPDDIPAENDTITTSCLETVEFHQTSNDFDEHEITAAASITTQLPQPIIRSDSFTVDEPSKCFLKHLEDSGVAASIKPICTSNANLSIKCGLDETKIVAKETVKRKTESKKITTPKLKKYSTKLFNIKKGRLSSDNISNLPEKIIRKNQNKSVNLPELRKEKPTIKSFVSPVPRKTSISQQEHSPCTQAISIPYQELTDATLIGRSEMIANVEEKYRTEIVFFLEKQKREQDAFLRKVMSEIKSKQETFQHNILMQIKAFIDDSLSKFMINHTNVLNPSNNYPSNDLNGNVSIVNDDDCKHTESNNCATKINACIRGYLTRRLFETEHVQQITKTIRDSRDLVIDLHLENSDYDSPAKVQMKHNLLQQLQSNKRTLLNIFTTNTMRERMGMIAFDREMMNFRLQNNVRNNNNCIKKPPHIDQRADYIVENKLKKLKIVKLFSDSISGYEAMLCSNQFQDT